VKIADTVLNQPSNCTVEFVPSSKCTASTHIEDAAPLELILNDFQDLYENEYLAMMRKKK
jgi:hypothetical protein